MHIGSPSYLEITNSRICDNQANLGGALFAEDGGSLVLIEACELHMNRAAGSRSSDSDRSEQLSAGGAIYIDAQVRIEVIDSNLTLNQAVGFTAEGGREANPLACSAPWFVATRLKLVDWTDWQQGLGCILEMAKLL